MNADGVSPALYLRSSVFICVHLWFTTSLHFWVSLVPGWFMRPELSGLAAWKIACPIVCGGPDVGIPQSPRLVSCPTPSRREAHGGRMVRSPGAGLRLQVANVAMLPGIVSPSMVMPDVHLGYGFAIGGVAAMDAEEGIISPGGVGYD